MKKALQKKALHMLLAAIAIFALASTMVAQQQNEQKPAASALVRLLQSKGILTEEEAALVGQAASPSESEQRLARLLLSKGLITQEDYNQTVGASAVTVATQGTPGAQVVPAVLRVPVNSTGSLPGDPGAAMAPKPAAPKVIPALAPIRVFPVDPPKREGLVPAFKLGPVRVTPYGFLKVSAIYDTSSPKGDDFPLPGFIGGLGGVGANPDTGPDAGPEFRVKARFARIGTNFEWIDPSPKMTITGRLEADFEGNFTRVNNTNLSSIRSNQFRIRLAWGRIDYAVTDHTSIHALFGQDWTPFLSSTLPPLFETSGAGVGFGTGYERLPQIRGGITHNFAGSRNFKIQTEAAAVLPAFGNTPGDGNLGLQLGIGERQGVDSARPEVQGRVAFQFQLDKAPGVAPAQIIASGMHGDREAIVRAEQVPPAFKAPALANSPFQRGAQAESSRYGYSGEIQLPTRYATLIAKYYNGEDLRFYFAGQLFSNFNDPTGFFNIVTVEGVPSCVAATAANSPSGTSIDGSSTVLFGFTDSTCTTAQVVPQRPVRSQGGFGNISFPLGRIFHANPDGRMAGLSIAFHYGIDYAKARDLRHFAVTTPTAVNRGSRAKSDMAAATFQWKLNNWVTFAAEESLYRTRALTGSTISGTPIPLPLFRGSPSREWHDLRSEFGTIFTF